MVLFIPKNTTCCVAAITANGRRAFRQGEAIPLEIVCRSAKPQAATVTLRLLDSHGAEVRSAAVPVSGSAAVEMPATLTRRLLPGTYTLAAQADGYAGYPLALDIAAGYADSPCRGSFTTNMVFPASSGANSYPDIPERMNYLRENTSRAVRDWGFTRETDRLAEARKGQLSAWRRDNLGNLADPSIAPVEYYDVLAPGHVAGKRLLPRPRGGQRHRTRQPPDPSLRSRCVSATSG